MGACWKTTKQLSKKSHGGTGSKDGGGEKREEWDRGVGRLSVIGMEWKV